MKLLGIFALVFMCEVLADYAWSRYIINTSAKRAHVAGMWSATIQLLATLTILGFFESRWVAVPAILGSYVGTVIAVRWDREPHEETPDDGGCYFGDLGKD